MHHTKRAARSLAWRDEKNPFSKTTYHRKRKSDLSRLESGDATHPTRAATNPVEYEGGLLAGRGLSPDTNALTAHAHTDPAATSRRRTHEPGDDIDQIPAAESPAASIRQSSTVFEKDIAVNRQQSGTTTLDTSDSAPHKRRSLKFWQKSEPARQDTDDSNGKNKKHFTAMGQIRATLFNSWINILLIASPVGIALHFAEVNAKAVFVVNFIAIIPLAAMLAYATEEIALRTGEVIGGLLNASFGNAVELIVSIIALTKDQVLIVQTSLIGSMLSNLLLVLGMCFFAGGVNRIEQAFNMTVAQTASSLLFLAVASLLIPTAFDEWANTGSQDRTDPTAPLVPGVTALSRATAIILLLVYGCYLFFQLKSHKVMYDAPSEKNKTRDLSRQKNKLISMIPTQIRKRSATPTDEDSSQTQVNGVSSSPGEPEEEAEEPQLSLLCALLTLLASTVLVALNAEFLVDSINAITCEGGISKTFVGLILLPIVGNAAEHATAVTVAIKDKMDLAIGVAVGSSMQIALLVLPLVVVLGWIIGQDDMTLYFDGFQIATLFVAVLLVNYLIQDGKSHWLEGILLMTLYIIIAVAAWYYPTDPRLNDCPAA